MRTADPLVGVYGIGWVDSRAWGQVRQRRRAAHDGGAGAPWRQAELSGGPVRNMGRFDEATRMVMTACALALKDAGLAPRASGTGTIGLVGTNRAGSLEANRAYFRDYVQAGRTLARGNLFIYTLPSSPLAETAIHFGLEGPLLYAGVPDGGWGNLLELAAELIGEGAATAMVAVRGDSQDAIAAVLAAGGTAGSASFRDVLAVCGGVPGDESAAMMASRCADVWGAGGV